MSIVKVVEVICEGKTVEDALNAGIQEAGKTIKNIKQIDVKWIRGCVEENKILHYRVNAKLSFVVEH